MLNFLISIIPQYKSKFVCSDNSWQKIAFFISYKFPLIRYENVVGPGNCVLTYMKGNNSKKVIFIKHCFPVICLKLPGTNLQSIIWYSNLFVQMYSPSLMQYYVALTLLCNYMCFFD